MLQLRLPASLQTGLRVAVIGLALSALGGCETLAITALGVGASAGVTHTASSVSYRTFTLPASQVKAASLVALNRMGIGVAAIDTRDGSELIRARHAERDIEIELEPMSKSTTQMRAVAKRNFFVHDAATAREIVEQTELAIAAAAQRGPLPDRRGRAAGAAQVVRTAL